MLWLHSLHHHQGREDINYSMTVTGSFKEPLDRQIMEKVQISNYKGDILMNRKKRVRRSNFRERAIQVQKMGGRGDYRWTKSSWDKMNTTGVPQGQIGFI